MPLSSMRLQACRVSLSKTPRAIMRFMNGVTSIIGSLRGPKGLKIIVETLGFQHLDLEVTVPRVVIFRDAIVDLIQAEMGAKLTPRAGCAASTEDQEQKSWPTGWTYRVGAWTATRTWKCTVRS